MVTDLVAKKVIYPVMSEEIMTEIRRVITEKFPEFTQHGKQLEKLLRHYASWMPLGSINVTVCRDPDDNKFIETALLGKCNYIISGDKDHLDLKTYKTITILSPAQFLDVIDEI